MQKNTRRDVERVEQKEMSDRSPEIKKIVAEMGDAVMAFVIAMAVATTCLGLWAMS